MLDREGTGWDDFPNCFEHKYVVDHLPQTQLSFTKNLQHLPPLLYSLIGTTVLTHASVCSLRAGLSYFYTRHGQDDWAQCEQVCNNASQPVLEGYIRQCEGLSGPQLERRQACSIYS